MVQQWKVEDYMKTIYALLKKGPARGAYIAEELNVSKATVCTSLQALEEEGYLVKLRDHSVTLTPKGMAIAQEITNRNAGIFDLLTSLGVDAETASRDACEIEHAISPESYDAIVSFAQCRAACEKLNAAT